MIFQYQERNQICNLKTISQGYNGVKNEKTICLYSIGYVKTAGLRHRNPLPYMNFQGERKSLSYPRSGRK